MSNIYLTIYGSPSGNDHSTNERPTQFPVTRYKRLKCLFKSLLVGKNKWYVLKKKFCKGITFTGMIHAGKSVEIP